MDDPLLVLATGAVIALMLGLFAALAISSIREQQRQEKRRKKGR